MFNSKKGIDDKVSNKLTTLSSQSLIKGDCSIDGDMRIGMLLDKGTFNELDKLVNHRCTNFGMINLLLLYPILLIPG